jgi:hypothetical protein
VSDKQKRRALRAPAAFNLNDYLAQINASTATTNHVEQWDGQLNDLTVLWRINFCDVGNGLGIQDVVVGNGLHVNLLDE